ncbi:MAG: hypothetical protein P8L18_00270 [Verrucomicrobiota bacterium]|nr:hypothetical protein [Verrucomicrobiota bacterium]
MSEQTPDHESVLPTPKDANQNYFRSMLKSSAKLTDSVTWGSAHQASGHQLHVRNARQATTPAKTGVDRAERTSTWFAEIVARSMYVPSKPALLAIPKRPQRRGTKLLYPLGLVGYKAVPINSCSSLWYWQCWQSFSAELDYTEG